MKLAGKVGLITGGGTGIGLAIARRFILEGAKVCITGRREKILKDAVKQFSKESITYCCGDVSNQDDAQAMIKAALNFEGRIDILVNNAAINNWGPITELSLEKWNDVFKVNVTGPFLLMKSAIPHMIEIGGGSIINISSLGGVRCIPGNPSYCTSKAALIMLTKQAALDYGPNKIRCNVVCPGGVETPLSARGLKQFSEMLGIDEESVKQILSSDVPLQRMAQASEISGICAYLAGSDSSFTTGSVIMVDGGASVVDVGRVAIKKALKKDGIKP